MKEEKDMERNEDPKKRLIVALDTDSPEKAKGIAIALRGEVGAFKIGMELFPRSGPEFVRAIREALGAGVMLDLKFHDIPNTVGGAVRSAAALGVKFCTIHASGGKAMMDAAAEAAKGTNTTVLAVTLLTSLSQPDLKELGFPEDMTAGQLVLRLAEMAVKAGVGGIVCSGKEVAAVRQCVGSGITLVTPGVRFPDEAVGDQKRVVTPDEAFKSGADYIVVGRPITKASDPVAAARKFVAAIADGLKARG